MNTIPSHLQLPLQVLETLHGYLNLCIGDIVVAAPYWRNRTTPTGTQVQGFLGGKATPRELQDQINLLISDESFIPADANHALHFLSQNRIGVDCSGFAFQLLEAFSTSYNKPSLEDKITPTPGGNPLKQKRFRTNADYLTRPENTIPIPNLHQIQPGDIIRLRSGKHLVIILSHEDNCITYAHSSDKTPQSGVHLNQIIITDPDKNIAHQEWQEQTNKAENYGDFACKSENGDGVFRLTWW